MDAARARGRQTDAQSPRELGIAASSERGRFFMADVDELNLVGAGSKRFEDAVDAVTWKAENRSNPPIYEPIDEHICYGVCHKFLPVRMSRS
jgi:hypothetical protein